MIEYTNFNEDKNKFLLMHGKCQDKLKEIPDESIHYVVTSPPYFGLRDYFSEDQLGQENSPEEYVNNLVNIFKEIKRVLRKDGTVWLNIGDSYNNSSGYCRCSEKWNREGRENGSADKKFKKHATIKQKDLFLIPFRLAIALQEDGWYIRQDIIYSKTNPMPDGAKDRPTRSHEYIFLMSKSKHYFYDYFRVLENSNNQDGKKQKFGAKNQKGTFRQDQERLFENFGKRNLRSVWTLPVASFKGEHFATFSPDLIKPCILASTSQEGCCFECGTPYERIIEKEKENDLLEIKEKGWGKKCKCKTDKIKRCIVLDPFNGTGTTGEVALSYNNNYIGIDTNEKYLNLSINRFCITEKQIENKTIQQVLDIKEIFGK